ncbi:hypothetical protein Ahy_A03g014647 [Arachis hypogaea]|uniref:Protein FAR1-RELATED SEQUENCE n=1 Tax=Arachis hypogaea TaxID=3818 RepID=A0A445DYG0_ARAHY|nr:hypothetical protein Ahy_A03g014647 [Arachis hypogaea]
MDHSTSDCQLNPGEVDYEFESNEVPEPLSVVDDQFIPKVGMTFTTLEDAGKFYRNYAKVAGFSTRVWSTNKKGNEIKNQLITCSREGKWKSKISPTEKTNPTAGLNCPARIYIHALKDVDAWIISKELERFSAEFWSCGQQVAFREQAERESDAADFHTVILCATKSSIEAQFQDVYTHQKFRKVQAQFRGKANCITRLTNSALGYSVYEVGEQVSSSIFNKFVVTYDSVAAEIKCQCLLFESRGILCRHALSVLSFEQVSQVSPRYILERGSKKVKRRHTHIKSSHDEPLMEPRSKRFDQLEMTAFLHRAYDNVMAEMESLKAKRNGTSSLSHEDTNLESVNKLQSPPRIRTRGRPKNRLGSKLDKQIANAAKKKKMKVLSKINLFDAASVVHSNNRQYQGYVMNYQFTVPAVVDNSLGV